MKKITRREKPMRTMRVTWEIDIEADTPEEAAERALEIQRNQYSTATVFTVIDKGKKHEIDLTPSNPIDVAMKQAEKHVAELPGAKILNCKIVDDWAYEVTFEHEGCKETQLVGSHVFLGR